MFPHRRKGEDVMRVLIVDDEQAPIFDYGDDTDPNGGAA